MIFPTKRARLTEAEHISTVWTRSHWSWPAQWWVNHREFQVQQITFDFFLCPPWVHAPGSCGSRSGIFQLHSTTEALVVIKMTLWHLFPKKRSVVDSRGHCQVQIKIITAAPSLSSFSLCWCPCSLLALQCSGNFCWPCQKCLISLRWGWSPVTGVNCTWSFGETSPEKAFKMAMDGNVNLYGSSSQVCTYKHI